MFDSALISFFVDMVFFVLLFVVLFSLSPALRPLVIPVRFELALVEVVTVSFVVYTSEREELFNCGSVSLSSLPPRLAYRCLLLGQKRRTLLVGLMQEFSCNG